ncbi:MAG: hypothetical protein HPY59_03970 [Anaerolineae bacterium]|nr:hypothetical protein [Anaerolineae bacterium]
MERRLFRRAWMAFSQDGSMLVVGAADKKVRFFLLEESQGGILPCSTHRGGALQ